MEEDTESGKVHREYYDVEIEDGELDEESSSEDEKAFVVDDKLDDCDANKSSSQQAKLPFDVFLYDICHPLFTMTIKLMMGKPLEKKGSEFLKHAIIFSKGPSLPLMHHPLCRLLICL